MGTADAVSVFALTGLKFVFPQLVTIPDLSQNRAYDVNDVYDAYYDFGIIGTALFAFIIGLTAAAVSIPVRQKKNPMTYMFYGQIAIYLGLAFLRPGSVIRRPGSGWH